MSSHSWTSSLMPSSRWPFFPDSTNPVLKEMWPDGHLSITEVTKRPLTAATLFKNSIVALVDKLACKVSPEERFTMMIVLKS